MKNILIKVPQQRRSQEKFNALLVAASLQFIGVGFKKTTTANIALEADVSIGTLYDYFSCKEALLIALLDGELKQCLSQALNKTKYNTVNASENLRALLQEGIAFAFEQQDLLRILFLDMPEYISTINLQQSRETVSVIAEQYTQRHAQSMKLPADQEGIELLLYSLMNIVLGFQFRIAILQDESYDQDTIVEQLIVIINPMLIEHRANNL